MPEFRGKNFTNERLKSQTNISKWKSLALYNTAVDDTGFACLIDAVNLQEIHVVSDKLADVSMRVLCTLPKLRSLLLDGVPGVTDVGIASVKNVAGLRELYLNGTHLTDPGMSALAGLADVWSLGLNETVISDTGLKAAAELTKIKILMLKRTRITGSGLKHLSTMERGHIYLDDSAVNDDALMTGLSAQHNVEILSLIGTDITDRCLPAIAKLEKLSDLRLSCTAITDRGIDSLVEHPNLRMLYLRETSVSNTMIERLKAFGRKRIVYS